jgi:hypothetical protein
MNERQAREFKKMLADRGIEFVDVTDQVMGEDMGGPKRQPREATIEAGAALFGHLNNIVLKAQAIIDDAIIADYKIDEVALLYTSEDEANKDTIALTMVDTVQVFNYARDHVHTRPLENCYDVTYRFIQNALYPWRMEVMSLDSGHSPLHESMIADGAASEDSPGIVHASFKVGNKEAYDEVITQMSESTDWVLGQACQSTYGNFSYWRYVGGEEGGSGPLSVWIKPRVNVRDGA